MWSAWRNIKKCSWEKTSNSDGSLEEGRDEIGVCGLGTRYTQGEKTVEFCWRNSLIITNIWSKQHNWCRYMRNNTMHDAQKKDTNYITLWLENRFMISIINSQNSLGTDAVSDYNLIFMKCILWNSKNEIEKEVAKMQFGKLKGTKKQRIPRVSQ